MTIAQALLLITTILGSVPGVEAELQTIFATKTPGAADWTAEFNTWLAAQSDDVKAQIAGMIAGATPPAPTAT